MTDNLERQWRDHVNDGAVVQWIKRTLRRWLNPRPPVFVLSMGVRSYGTDGTTTKMYMQRQVHPDTQPVKMPLIMPIAVRDGQEVYVVIEDFHIYARTNF